MRLIFESESSCWSDSSTDDSIEDESGDDNLGLDFFPIFNVSFYLKSQHVRSPPAKGSKMFLNLV